MSSHARERQPYRLSLNPGVPLKVRTLSGEPRHTKSVGELRLSQELLPCGRPRRDDVARSLARAPHARACGPARGGEACNRAMMTAGLLGHVLGTTSRRQP